MRFATSPTSRTCTPSAPASTPTSAVSSPPRTNQTYEAFVNIPLIDGVLGFRASAFSVSNGGFINNQLTTRTWVNGAVSNNAEWAGHDYNHENVKGGRLALKAQFGEDWNALLTYGFQQQHTNGAWDEDPTLAPRTVARFGPEQNLFETNMVDFHLDGDVGIGDLVFASAFWNQERRQWNEYSEYEQNYNGGTQEGFTCLNDPYYGGGPFTGCNPATQFYSYNVNPQRWSNELRLSSKVGGRFHWLVGGYWQVTNDHNYSNTYYMPGLQYKGAAFQYELNAYHLTQASLPPGVWYTYTETSHDLETSEFANISFDVTDKLNVEAGAVYFHSYSNLRHAGIGLCLRAQHAERLQRDLAQDGRQGRRQLQNHRSRAGLRRLGAGLPAGWQQFRITFRLLQQWRDPNLYSGHAQ